MTWGSLDQALQYADDITLVKMTGGATVGVVEGAALEDQAAEERW